jgi:replicative DNA helicase
MKHSELTLLGHLSDADSLDELAKEGYLTESIRETIPTEWVRRVVAWALDRFFTDGRMVPPSRQAIKETWDDTFERFEVELPDPELEIDTIGWVIADLKANHARVQAQTLGTEFASAMGMADGPDRVPIFTEYAERFYVTAQSLISRRNEADGFFGVRQSLISLSDRIENGHQNRGMHLGVDLLDQHTHGTHPGEITTLAAESGVGKSWMAGLCCLKEWRRGRRACLITLENDVPMTYDRLACMATGVPYEAFQVGQVSDDQLKALFALMDEMEASENRPLIAQIDPSQRTPSGIVRRAQLEGAQSLIVDQLSFVRPEQGTRATQRNFQVVEIGQRFKELIQETAISMLLLVQINREGAKAARKEGRYQKEHMQESSGIEQISDFLWALYRSSQMEIDGTVQFQCLKARRVIKKSFEAFWQPHMGVVRGLGEIDIDRQAEAA